jgi:hypothetical protein
MNVSAANKTRLQEARKRLLRSLDKKARRNACPQPVALKNLRNTKLSMYALKAAAINTVPTKSPG